MPCPQPQLLQQLLDETLPAAQQPALQAHLDSCASCQKALERLAAGGVTWDKAAQNLGAQSTHQEPALEDAVARLQNASTDPDQTRAEPAGATIPDELTFLQPSQKPGSIGRLDEFEILSVIGKGGFGIVLKAFDESLHRIVAIKVMAPQMAASGAARARFVREARAAAPIHHENVVTIHKVSPDGAKFPYLAMHFVSGVTLNEKIDKTGPLPVKEILRIGMQIADGLAAAHKQGLVHRDIKPGNILLENGVERVKITDFGLARTTDDASVTQSGTVAGTPMYMSPEQAAGDPIDHRSDLFSLGSVLYVMCTGRPPFRASTTLAVMKRVAEDTPTPVREINGDIPEWLAAIVTKLHAKKPADRFPDAKEVAEVLAQHLADMQAGRSVSVSGASVATSTVTPPAAPPVAPPQVGFLGTMARLLVMGWTMGAAAGLVFGVIASFSAFVEEKPARVIAGVFAAGMLITMAFGTLIFIVFGAARWALFPEKGRNLPPRGRTAPVVVGLLLITAAPAVYLAFYGVPGSHQQKGQLPVHPPFVPVFGGEGWRRLFNGQDLAGWKEQGDSRITNSEIALFPNGAIETLEKMPRHAPLP
jgi:serine/threonine-protein kinase